MPVLTRLGRYWAASGLLLLLLSLLFRSHLALTLAAAAILGLALDAVLTFPLGRRARRAGLELSWWISGTEDRPPAVVSAKIPIEGHLRLHTPAHLRLVSISAVVDDALEVEIVERPLELRGGAPSRFKLTARPKSVGRHVLQGLSTLASGPFGAFAVGLYFPHPLEVRALPRSLAMRADRAAAAAHERLEGASRLRRAGTGTDLHELRAHRPGDSLKQVAWKASARRGRLLVREVEQEVQETHWLVLDLGSSMFAGSPGARRIDRAIEDASSESRRLLDEGHRVGLVSFDARVLDVVPPSDGSRQRIVLLEKLTEAVHVVDSTRIDADEVTLARFVAEHLRGQEARLHSVESERDRAVLAQLLARGLEHALGERAPTPAEVFLTYCHAHGLRVPPRATPPDGARDQALEGAILRVLRGGAPTGIHLFSDLDEIGAETRAVASLRLASARGRLRLHIPDSAAPSSSDPLTRALLQTFHRAEAQKHRRILHALERRDAPRGMA